MSCKSLLQLAAVMMLIIVGALIGCSDDDNPSSCDSIEYTTFYLPDFGYARRVCYDLGRMALDRSGSDTLLEPEKYDFDILGRTDSIVKCNVYYDDNPGAEEQLSRLYGIAYIDPDDTLSDDPNSEYRTIGYFAEVDPSDFYVERRPPGENASGYYIQFFNSVPPDNILAVHMIVRRNLGGIAHVDTIGDINGDTLRLKLIKPRNHFLPNRHVWEYEWKNIYRLNYSHFDVSKMKVDIYKYNQGNYFPDSDDPNNQNGIPYIRILGLDQGDAAGMGIPDNLIDYSIYIDRTLGLLYFPDRHPFDSRIAYATDPDGHPVYLNDSVPELYNTTSPVIIQEISKYYMKIQLPAGYIINRVRSNSEIIE